MFTETQGNKKYDQKSYCGVMESTTAPMVCVIKFFHNTHKVGNVGDFCEVCEFFHTLLFIGL